MSGRGSRRHIHKYHKISFAGMQVFACALSDCTHYMPQHMEAMIIGKASYCWECDNPMVMDEISKKMDKPICVNCRTKKIELPAALLTDN